MFSSKIKKKYPSAKVLKSGQDFERPKDWKQIENVQNITSSWLKN